MRWRPRWSPSPRAGSSDGWPRRSRRAWAPAIPARRDLREHRLPLPRAAGGRGPHGRHRHRPRGRPLAGGAAGVAAARRGRRPPRGAVAARPHRPPRLAPTQRRDDRRPAASPPCATSPTSTTATASTARDDPRLGRRRRHDGDGEPLPADVRWQAELWRRAPGRVGHAEPGGAPRGCVRGSCATSPASSTFPSASRSSASPACRRATSTCSRRSPTTATSTSSSSTRRPRCGSASRPFARSAASGAPRRRPHRRLPLNPLLRHLGPRRP